MVNSFWFMAPIDHSLAIQTPLIKTLLPQLWSLCMISLQISWFISVRHLCTIAKHFTGVCIKSSSVCWLRNNEPILEDCDFSLYFYHFYQNYVCGDIFWGFSNVYFKAIIKIHIGTTLDVYQICVHYFFMARFRQDIFLCEGKKTDYSHINGVSNIGL